MALIALRSTEDTAVKLPREQLVQKNVEISTPSKSSSCYAISNNSQSEAYHLPEL